jgi:nucleoside phosphorylase
VALRAVGIGAGRVGALAADPALAGARALLVAGLAGGCDPRTRPGDLVVAEAIGQEPGGVWRPTDAALRAAARRVLEAAGLRHHAGRLLTVPAPVATPEAKAETWRRQGALAVEMESGPVAAWAAARGLPVLAVRAIADGPADRLPARLLELVDSRGRLSPGALGAVLRQPALLADGWRLWRRSRLALRRLARCLDALVALPLRP